VTTSTPTTPSLSRIIRSSASAALRPQRASILRQAPLDLVAAGLLDPLAAYIRSSDADASGSGPASAYYISLSPMGRSARRRLHLDLFEPVSNSTFFLNGSSRRRHPAADSRLTEGATPSNTHTGRSALSSPCQPLKLTPTTQVNVGCVPARGPLLSAFRRAPWPAIHQQPGYAQESLSFCPGGC